MAEYALSTYQQFESGLTILEPVPEYGSGVVGAERFGVRALRFDWVLEAPPLH